MSRGIPGPADSLGLSGHALPLLRDVVHERLGLFYDEARLETFADRLAPLAVERGFTSYLDYYYFLKYDPSAAAEWPRVMDALSVAETYFWREIDQVQAIATHVVPALQKAHPYTPVRIWSVPCAGGEEPLTIAMAIAEAGLFERGPIAIHGSDASPAAIERARAGRYRERAFRSLPPALRDKYFVADGDAWVPSSELRSRVSGYSVVNLLAEAEVALYVRAPIIFCRNVFIYFSAASVQRVVDQFDRDTPEPAWLCLGASESLLKTRSRFDLEEIGGAFVYVKRGSSMPAKVARHD
jgi:chemotaxis protein methyltransferase CheR